MTGPPGTVLNGLNGQNGASPVLTPLTDNKNNITGYSITINGKLVGEIKNGTDGQTPTFTPIIATDGKTTGYTIRLGNTIVGTIQNGQAGATPIITTIPNTDANGKLVGTTITMTTADQSQTINILNGTNGTDATISTVSFDKNDNTRLVFNDGQVVTLGKSTTLANVSSPDSPGLDTNSTIQKRSANETTTAGIQKTKQVFNRNITTSVTPSELSLVTTRLTKYLETNTGKLSTSRFATAKHSSTLPQTNDQGSDQALAVLGIGLAIAEATMAYAFAKKRQRKIAPQSDNLY